ncbi:MAG: hypothetical protein KIT00_06170 [Rhodospirillales bacterium]|nr:hypothetical protein [Rhodospirillales bacterium]
MKSAQQRAVRAHRHRRKDRGIVRVEVQAPEGDASLIRTLAAALRSDPETAHRVRTGVREALLPPEEPTLLELLACDFPDEIADLTFERQRDFGRDVSL